MPTLLDDIYTRLGGGDDSRATHAFSLQEGNGLVSLLQTPCVPPAHPGILGPGVQGAVPCRNLVQAIKGIVSSAQTIVDVATPAPFPDGAFLDGLIAGLVNRTHPDSPLLVRIHAGFNRADRARDVPASVAVRSFLERLTAELAPSAPITIAAALTAAPTGASAMRNGTIVAADGQLVIVGGHSLRVGDYAAGPRPQDLSMLLCGPAATTAHEYCDQLWADRSIVDRSVCTPTSASMLWSAGTIRRAGPSCRPDVHPDTAGTVRTLSIAALGASLRHGSERDGAGSPDQVARVAAFDAARSTIRISQHDFAVPTPSDDSTAEDHQAGTELQVIAAVARALERGVDVYIAVTAGAGCELADPAKRAAATREALIDWLSALEGMSLRRFADMLARLHIAALAPATPALPAGSSEPAPNRSTVYIVDDSVAFVGSDLPSAESGMHYGMLIEEPEALVALLDTYWTPLWADARCVQ